MKWRVSSLLAFSCALALRVHAQTSGAPVIASLSSSQTVTEGQNLSLTVSVNGTPPFSYQWRRDGNNIAGATFGALAFSPIRATDAGSYSVVVSNALGATTSGPILIAVTPASPPSLSSPGDRTVTVGTPLNLGVSASGTTPITFEWKKNGVTIATTTSSGYSIPSAQFSDAGVYTVVATNIVGSATSPAFNVTVTAPVAPTITGQPTDRIVDQGDFLNLNVSVNGTSPINLQWFKDGVALSGATSSFFSKSNAQPSDAGSYTVTATNAVGSVTSNAARVTVRPGTGPTINSMNGGGAYNTGSSVGIQPSISGTPPYTYQWFKDGIALAGQTSSSIAIQNVQSSDVGAYTVTVANPQGSVTSPAAAVSVVFPQPPIITRHPASMVFVPGNFNSLSVAAVGASPLSFQWRKDGAILSNGTDSNYSLPSNFAASDAGSYTVVVSNSLGSVVSEPAIVTATAVSLPSFSTHPTSMTVVVGDNLSLSTEIAGATGSTFQWKKDNAVIAGATNTGFSKANVALSDAGTYTLTATNAAGSVTSVGAVITVVPESAPVITQHPSSFSLAPGSSGNVSVSVRSSPTLRYQWRRDGTTVPNATSANFFISGGQASNAGTYDVIVSNSAGSVTSQAAVVTVDITRPLITQTPGGVLLSSNSGFFSLAIGTSTLNVTYQWRKDGTVIPNATNSGYSFSSFTAADAGAYTVEVKASDGTTVTSRPIPVDLLDRGVAPRITRQPTAADRTAGNTAGFSISVIGEQPVTYQWRKDGVVIPGATRSDYSVNAAASAAGDYTVVVTNGIGTVTSAAARLTVLSSAASSPPVIRTQPASIAISSGNSNSNASLFVGLDFTSQVTYQWRKDGVPIPGAVSSSYTFFVSPSTIGNALGRYSVVVTNPAGSVTSSEANVTLVDLPAPPVIVSQPQGQNVLQGSSIALSATVTGASPMTFEWRKGGVARPGATSSTLALGPVQPADAGVYTLIATNLAGVTASTSAVVNVQIPAAGLPIITTQPRSGTVIPGASTVLFAGVAANPAATYQWRKDGANVPGATTTTLPIAGMTAAQAGHYTLIATNSFGSATTGEAVISLGAEIKFATLSTGQTAAAGTALTLSPGAQSPVALTYQWRKNGVDLPGATSATLAFASLSPRDSGGYTLVATNRDGALESPLIQLNVTSSPFAGVYFGSLGGTDTWALAVAPEGTGTFIGIIGLRSQAIIARDFPIQPDGTFTASSTAFGLGRFNGSLSGLISGGTVTGQLVGATSFTGTRKPSSGTTEVLAGLYRAVPLVSSLGETYVIVAADGTLQLVSYDASNARGGRGTVGPTGAFSVIQPQFVFTGSLGAGGSSFAGTFQAAGSPIVSLAAPPAPNGAERLANVSTRGVAGSGARTLIAGFVVTGSSAKDVLVRGVGPALAGFGVSGVLGNPRLRIMSGSTVLFENDDWGLGSAAVQIAATAARLGAFPFAVGSADAALLVRLNPGSYTAQVTSDIDASGVALVEVYDASTSGADSQKLINLSTRGDVGTGTNILIVGFVVSGNAPKKVLIRGIGPTLASFGVTGNLDDPRLQLYRGGQLLVENDNWSSGSDASLIADAAQAVGAFALPNGSRDAALLLYLAPGSYTAQISGVQNTTGVGLLEVYEAP